MDSNINKVDVLAESVSASIKAFLIKENNVSTTVEVSEILSSIFKGNMPGSQNTNPLNLILLTI